MLDVKEYPKSSCAGEDDVRLIEEAIASAGITSVIERVLAAWDIAKEVCVRTEYSDEWESLGDALKELRNAYSGGVVVLGGKK